jgi:hypothetical protein
LQKRAAAFSSREVSARPSRAVGTETADEAGRKREAIKRITRSLLFEVLRTVVLQLLTKS